MFRGTGEMMFRGSGETMFRGIGANNIIYNTQCP